jgi:phage I-like protein
VSQVYGYWVDLAKFKFDDGGALTNWIMAAPLGKYNHPVYGEIDFTPEKLKDFADNVNNGTRGQELDIDYDHKQFDGTAAGWVKQAEVRANGLWLLVEWTKKAYELLRDKAYRYFSPEFNDEWQHPETGQKHRNVLFGGALTNRPFLKSILPINLSELFGDGITPPAPTPPAPPPAPTNPEPPKGGQMDPKKLREVLGLAEDATDEQVVAKLQEVTAPRPPTYPDLDSINEPAPDEMAKMLKSLADIDGNPALKALTELVEAQRKQLSQYAMAARRQRVESQLADLDRGKTFAVPPAVKDQLRDILLRSPDQLGAEVFDAYKKTLEMGIIDLTERGWQRRGDEKSPAEQYLSEIDALMSRDKGLTYAEAAQRVSRTNPQLAMEYREESYIPMEGR